MYSENFEIGRRIKEEREEKRITQEQLAELSDLSPNYISKMENGTYTNIGSKHLIDICNALNITMSDLFQDNLNEQQRVSELPLNIQKLGSLSNPVDEEITSPIFRRRFLVLSHSQAT